MEVNVTKRKFNIAKVVWLILLCFGITFFSANNSQATPIPITVTNIIATGPAVQGVPYATQYWLETLQYGKLDAFCVESANAFPIKEYELVQVPSELSKAAEIASRYFDGSVIDLDSIANEEEAKVATQLAIWDILTIASTTDEDYLKRIQDIKTLILSSSSISDSIYLARSPIGGGEGVGQDYLTSVPDASIMFLLGPALLGLGLLGRRRRKSKS